MTIEITTKEQMALIGNDPAYPLSGQYVLMNDIDLDGDEDNQWTPIAPLTFDGEGNPTLENRFSGDFDGNGKTISGIYVNDLSDGVVGKSLFGVVSGTVRHLKTEGSITLKNGENGGTISAGLCVVILNGGIVEECESAVDCTGYSYIAGIASFIYSGGSIINCKAAGTITGTVFVAGICCGVADFEATKDVAYIAKNVFVGTMNFTGADPAKYGVGMICFPPVLADPQIYFASDRCYWDYELSPFTNSYVGEAKTTAELYQQATYVHWNFNTVWGIDEGTSYPYLLRLEKVTVPNVVGYELADAYSALEALGLTVTVVIGSDSDCDAGLVCSQSKAAGEQVSYGTDVTLTVAIADDTGESTESGVQIMANMLRTGTSWLGNQRVAHASSEVTYRTLTGTCTVNATYGDTRVDVTDESGMTVVAKVWDFIIKASELEAEPEPGDIITADGNQYEVMNLGGEAWRYSDPYRTAYRVHTKNIGSGS